MSSNPKINRRTAGQVMLSAAAAAYLAPVSVVAQPFDKKKKKDQSPKGKDPSQQPTAPEIDLTRILMLDKRHDWTLKGEVNVNAWVRPSRDLRKELPEVQEFHFTSASVVFPLLRGSSSHKMYDRELSSELRFNQTLMADKPGEMLETFPCGTRLGRWDLKAPDNKVLTGREMKLALSISMTSWRTLFDEKLAEQIPWPKGGWGPVSATTFSDLQRVGDLNLVDHTTEGIQTLVRGWCGGKDPKTIAPVQLAKWLASNVLEYIQTSGDGLNFADNGLLEGMQVRGSEATLRERRGSDQDVTCALAAVFRAAGIPCRTVIGFDVLDDKGGKDTFLKRQRDVPAFRSYVEFCLYDEKTRKEIWIPVDVNRQRKKSSRIVNNMSAWQYFGKNDELDMVCPFAFQFHPPTSVIAHGSVSFWGWLTFPAAPQATQFLRFDALTTPKTTDTEKNRLDQDDHRNPHATTPARK